MKPIVILFSLLLTLQLSAQDPKRFSDEIEDIKNNFAEISQEDLVIFTGSSSIRMWKSIDNYFPKKNILNHGFGGSQTSDLVCYANELILSHKASKIFIYEGDNDLSDGKSTDIILADMKTLIRVIKRRLPETRVYLISPKPSLARWDLKEKYVTLNTALEALAQKQENVTFISVWDEMLSSDGSPKKELFIQDGLHMTEEGYKIWAKAIGPHLK